MDIGLVIDATCDVTWTLVDEQGLVVLPHVLEFAHRHVLDSRDPATTLKIYRRYLTDRSISARSEPAGVGQLRELFLSDAVLRRDRVLVLTASEASSAMHANATQASYAMLQEYKERRAAAGRSDTFVLRVVDSGTIGSGLAALTLAALREMRSGVSSFDKLRRVTRDLASRTRCRIVPADLPRLRQRTDPTLRPARRAVDSVASRWLGVYPVLEMTGGDLRVVGRIRDFGRAVTRVLEWAYGALVNGRVRPTIAISIGGDPRIVRQLESYQALEALAAARRCDLQLSVMSATLAVAYGPGAFSIGVIDI